MKKLLIVALLLITSVCSAQKKYTGSDDKSGLVLASVGATSITIGLFVPDGSEWTYKNSYNSQIITKPFYKNPARDCMITFGVAITIGGLRYNHLNK